MSKHTPGPWAFDDNGGEHDQPAINEATPGGGPWKAIATAHIGRLGGGSSPIQPEEAEANARLIAAAPELLAALKAMLKAWIALGNDTPSMPGFERTIAEQSRAAIANAEGELT